MPREFGPALHIAGNSLFNFRGISVVNHFRLSSIALFIICMSMACFGHSADPKGAMQHQAHPLSLVLIKSTLTSVNHGNITGNYTVLRELGSARFKQEHTPADLATAFAALRGQKVDLSPVLVNSPELIREPFQDENGRLHFEGYCHLVTHRVHFHLVYETLAHGWLIDDISIGIMPINPHVASTR